MDKLTKQRIAALEVLVLILFIICFVHKFNHKCPKCQQEQEM